MATNPSPNWQRLGYRRIVQLLVYLVIVPTALLLLLGFVTMFTGEARYNIVLGMLTVSFVSVVVTGVVLVLVFVRRAANLSELQADFVSKVSHELRTPLTAIRLFVETIDRAQGDAATQRKCVSALLTETERLTGRIERLLDWGRMEAGRKLYELRPVAVADVMDEVMVAFSPAKTLWPDATVTVHVEPDLPPIVADRHAIVDALGNLLSNAFKYGGNPAVVEVRARLDGRNVAFEVKDNGAGIPRHEHARIFQKFYRIDDRLARVREGSGLGLAIVKHVARAHGGSILLDSAPGQGSTFRLLLPLDAKPSERTRSVPPRFGELDGGAP